MTSKLVSALKRQRLKHLLTVLQAHGVTDWTVSSIKNSDLQLFGIGDAKIRRRLLKGFESVAKIKPPPATMVDVEGGTQTSWMSELNGTTVESFRIGIYTVTWGEWERVRNWALSNGFKMNSGSSGGPMHPVVEISWYNALKWCNAKSLMEGLEPTYYLDGERGCFAKGQLGSRVPESLLWLRAANGYRLPTDAEWEWAARGAIKSKRYCYSGSNEINKVAWWYGDKTDSIGCHPVGDKKPNELGIYDMSGNAMEFCWDTTNFSPRVRGGSWKDYSYDCRLSDRSVSADPNYCSDEIGFRLVRNSSNKTDSHG
jgi:sulfatase modifying factor 1